jgi:DNA-3-methyladenine glycosylase
MRRCDMVTPMHMILPQSFFCRDVCLVARDLLGTYLVCEKNEKRSYSLITEVEAYDGPDDLACHGSKGKTSRTDVMFGPGGYFYVYLIYGMYYMLNVVTGEEGYPAAILIRGAGEYRGPGILTRELEINKNLNATSISHASGVWIEDHGMRVRKDDVVCTPRIGVSYAGEWAQKPYRFVLTNQRIKGDRILMLSCTA